MSGLEPARVRHYSGERATLQPRSGHAFVRSRGEQERYSDRTIALREVPLDMVKQIGGQNRTHKI